VIDLRTVDSPIGPLTMATRADRLCLLHFGADEQAAARALARWFPGVVQVSGSGPTSAGTALSEYFAGRIEALDRIEVEMNGTAFQIRVWNALRVVPPGTTTSYGEIARRIGAPSAVRAVGAANGANPIAIVVPCHRIIGGNGSLTGYGGGLERKQWLLQHERAPGLF
jgi:methylated-DNA-[protein]-cysteine S-methyltransferase